MKRIPALTSIIIAMKRYSSVVASFIIMAALGGLYAWSIFVQPLKEEAGVTTGFTQLIFGVIIGILPLAMVLGGRIVINYGPKVAGILSAVLFGAGYIVSFVFRTNPAWLLIGIGLMSGIGTGFGYIAALSTPVKWFPERRGLITGISTSGFGAGAIFLSLFVRTLLLKGLSVYRIFLYIGLLYGTIVFLSSLLLFEPESFKDNVRGSVQKWHFDFIKRRDFWALFLGMFSGSFAGLVVIGNLKPIAAYLDIGDKAALAAISVLSLGNTAGRVLWGYIADIIGVVKSIRLSLFLLGLSVIFLFWAPSGGVFIILSLITGLAFGANFVLYAASTSIIFGTDRLSEIYPFVSFAYGLGGILGPPIGGFSYDFTDSYSAAILISAIVAILGSIIATALLTTRPQEALDNSERV